MKGIVVAGSLIRNEYDVGKYYLYDDYGNYYIYKEKTFTLYRKLISKSTVKTFEIVFSEIKYDSNDQMYNSYLVSIIFYDGTNALLECDAQAARLLTIELY